MSKQSRFAIFALVSATALVAAAQPPALSRHAQVGLATIDGVVDECDAPPGACETAAGTRLEITTRAAAIHVRAISLEATHALFTTPPPWTARPVTRLQLDTDTPVAGSSTVTIPAGGAHTLGVLHAQEPLGHGIEYRVTLEVDGQRVVVHASEHVVMRHPIDR